MDKVSPAVKELYLSHPNIQRRGKIPLHMLYQQKSQYEQFTLPSVWAKIFDTEKIFQYPENVRFLLRQHNNTQRTGRITPHMLFQQTIIYDEFEIPEMFNTYFQEDTSVKQHQSLKQVIHNMNPLKSTRNDENLTPRSEKIDTQEKRKKHPIKNMLHMKS